MPIITISRGSKSGGEALARLIAEKLNCPNLISREVLVKVSEVYGIGENELISTMNDPPHFWSRSTRTKRRRLYLTYIRAALLDYAAEGCIVYHGNAGHFLLNDIGWILKVRLIAPLEKRIAALQETMDLDKYQAALYIKKVDEDRMKWTKFLYNEDWNDPSHFDIVINLKHISLETASNTIFQMSQTPEFARTEKRVQDLENKALAARVQAALEANPKTREAEVDITADGSVIQLSGQISHKNLRSELITVTSNVRGVTEVKDFLTNY